MKNVKLNLHTTEFFVWKFHEQNIAHKMWALRWIETLPHHLTWKHWLDDANGNTTDEFNEKQHGHSRSENKSENLWQIEDRFGLVFVALFVGLFVDLCLFRDVRNENDDQNDAKEWSAGSKKRRKLFTDI